MSLSGADGERNKFSTAPIPLKEHPTPLVIVEGFLGGGPMLWGNFGKHCDFDVKLDDENPRRRIIFARYDS